jgi:hypothetical protein
MEDAMRIDRIYESATVRLIYDLRCFSGKRWIAGIALLVVVAVFPDVCLTVVAKAAHVFGFLLHLFVGVLELGIEHLVHSAFDVHRHTAQLITAWTLFFLFMGLLVWLVRKLLFRIRVSRWPKV